MESFKEFINEGSYNKREMDSLGKVGEYNPSVQFRLDGKSTKWMDVTPDAFEQIKKILSKMK